MSSPLNAKSTAQQVLAGLQLKGKTILLTGSNSGIGLASLKCLAEAGATMICLARTTEAARRTVQSIRGNHVPLGCDLSDLNDVRDAVQKIRQLQQPIDVIITNAGLAAPSSLQVKHGVEVQFLVNYLAHFYLVTELLDRLPDNAGRVVIGSSSASIQQAPKEGLMFDNLDGRQFYRPFTLYGQSKFATALFAKELSRRVSSRGISVNSVHPGATAGTKLNDNLSFPLKILMSIARYFMKTPEQGAATQCLLAALPVGRKVTGEYWADCQVAEGNPLLDDPLLANELWRVSEQILRRELPA
ncbi:SDR family NAD(P)-dependent oxidoreductase [Pantoea cypripedii]|uniref:Short-chain dehydrogenase/reductase SDR n=1 Tax=Pantoea cypripedii TaxID=55209 RepID=A0A6B9GDX6_PANCY|nr:SDR family NAD(P)-dependent oxidoreductase [Pantoea cypripedii]QGY32447.1 short-chain dehydrogenase/reductase SDR [Pantoea cypripedii]